MNATNSFVRSVNSWSFLVSSGTLSNTLPAQSVTLFVLPAAVPAPRLRPGTNTGGQIQFWLDGQTGQRYVIQSSPDLTSWAAFSTNTPASNSIPFLVPSSSAVQSFYRAFWSP